MLAGIAAVYEDDDVMLITNTGMIIRTRAAEISIYSRTATGVRVMRLGNEGMKIVSFTRVDKQQEVEQDSSLEEATDSNEASEEQAVDNTTSSEE